jgi:hypothetical protein
MEALAGGHSQGRTHAGRKPTCSRSSVRFQSIPPELRRDSRAGTTPGAPSACISVDFEAVFRVIAEKHFETAVGKARDLVEFRRRAITSQVIDGRRFES